MACWIALSLGAVNDPQVIRLLAQALNDTSAEVRAAALEAVSILADRSDPIAVELLIETMKDPDARLREEASENLEFLIDQKLETYEEAQSSWARNKDKYDAWLIGTDETLGKKE